MCPVDTPRPTTRKSRKLIHFTEATTQKKRKRRNVCVDCRQLDSSTEILASKFMSMNMLNQPKQILISKNPEPVQKRNKRKSCKSVRHSGIMQGIFLSIIESSVVCVFVHRKSILAIGDHSNDYLFI